MADVDEQLTALEEKLRDLEVDREAREEERAMQLREKAGADLSGGTPGSVDINQKRRDYIDGKTSIYPG